MTNTSNDAVRDKTSREIELESITTDSISARLLEACNGHPHAKIPWPHYLLHDAVFFIRKQHQAALTHITQLLDSDEMREVVAMRLNDDKSIKYAGANAGFTGNEKVAQAALTAIKQKLEEV